MCVLSHHPAQQHWTHAEARDALCPGEGNRDFIWASSVSAAGISEREWPGRLRPHCHSHQAFVVHAKNQSKLEQVASQSEMKGHLSRSPTSCRQAFSQPFLLYPSCPWREPSGTLHTPHRRRAKAACGGGTCTKFQVANHQGELGRELVSGAELGPVQSLLGCHVRHQMNILTL